MKFLSQEVIQTCIKTLKYKQTLIRKKQMPKYHNVGILQNVVCIYIYIQFKIYHCLLLYHNL